LLGRTARDPKQRRPQNDQHALRTEHTPTSIHDREPRSSNATRKESTSRPIVVEDTNPGHAGFISSSQRPMW
jgi:hypothetical protein